jgi:diazepam-binding inhibitor (GABA receptor modulator, acyl-CoA-binding protein)
MDLRPKFDVAVKNVGNLTKRPTNDELLELYGLFKQATEGDAKGTRPGLFDLKGRKKHDAWSSQKGKSTDQAMKAYIETVNALETKYR